MERFRGGLVFKAHRLVYHSTLGSSAIKKEEEVGAHDLYDASVPPARRQDQRRVQVMSQYRRVNRLRASAANGFVTVRFGAHDLYDFSVPPVRRDDWGAGCKVYGVQGYLAHKKPQPP